MGRYAGTDEFEEYRENGLCPYCFAEDVVDDGSEWSGNALKKHKYCTKCELRWTEEYHMTGVYLTDADD
jgi:transcriptional regulator NrdR family protein